MLLLTDERHRGAIIIGGSVGMGVVRRRLLGVVLDEYAQLLASR